MLPRMRMFYKQRIMLTTPIPDYDYLYFPVNDFEFEGLGEIYPDDKVHAANMGPSGADRTQVGPMFAPWTLQSGQPCERLHYIHISVMDRI